MARMQYPSSWDHCINLYKNVRDPARGKNLGATYFRLKFDKDVFKVYYGGWNNDDVADERSLQYTIDKDNIVTIHTAMNYNTVNEFNVGHLYRHIEKGIHMFYPQFYKTWDKYGWMLYGQFPVFTGFKMDRNKREVLTQPVADIEAELELRKVVFKKNNRELIKMLRLYNKFDAFREADEYFNTQTATWQVKREMRERISYGQINPEDINSLAWFVAARKAFSVYGITNATMTGHWQNRQFDYNKLIPQLLQHGALNELAKIRDEKYKDWYNTGTPNNP